MAEVSRIIIKTSTATDTPGSGVLNRGELAYSYQSNRLFIGDENSDSNYVIGGTSIFESFNDIVDESGVTQAGIVFANNVIIAGPNKDLDELDIKKLKLDGEVLLASANNLNVFSNVDGIIIANTLPNVSHTKLVSAQAIKEYVDIKTDIISDFINGTPAPAQLLIGNEQSKFEYVDVTGAVEFFANGYSTLRESSITNSMMEDAFVQIGLQKVELGKAIVPNLNLDTSGILKVNRGGTGKSSHPENQLLIGNNISEFTSSENLIFDSANQIFTVNATASINEIIANDVTVNGYLLLNGDTNISSNTVGFSGNTQVIIEGDTIISGNTFNITNTTNVIIEGDTNYYSNTVTFSNTTNINIEGDTNYYSNTVTFSNTTSLSVSGNTIVSGDTFNISQNTVFNIEGDTNLYGNTVISADVFNISNNTTVEIEGDTNLYGNTVISGDTFNISQNTVFAVDGDTYLNSDVYISNNSTTVIEGPLISNNTSTFNGDVIFNSSPSFEEDVFFQKNITVEKDAYIIGDLFVSGNTVSVEAQRVLVEDNILVLGANNTTDFVDLGFVGQYDGNNYAGIIRSALEDKFYVVEDYFPEPGDTLYNFNENTMLGILRGIFEADRIEIASGNANNITISNSALNNVTLINSTAPSLNIGNLIANNITVTDLLADTISVEYIDIESGTANGLIITHSTLNNATLNNPTIPNAYIPTLTSNNITSDVINVGSLYPERIFADSVKIYDELIVYSPSVSRYYGSVDFYSDVDFTNATVNLNNSTLSLNNTTVQGLKLGTLDDVNDTSTANQVLTADGTGSFYFATPVSELKLLTDVDPTATANQVLTADGTGNYYFTEASDPIAVRITNTSNAILSTITNVNDFRFDSDSGFDVVDLGAGAVKIQMNSTFKTLKVDGEQDLVAFGLDTLELVAGPGIVINTDPTGSPYKTLTFSSPSALSELTDVDSSNSVQNEILTAYGNGVFYFSDSANLASVTTQNLIVTNSTLENITANNITANTYSGIYLDMLENVNSTATANQVLIADGTGNFYFNTVESILSNSGLNISNNTFNINSNTEFIVSGNTIVGGDTFNIGGSTTVNIDGDTNISGNTNISGDNFTINSSTELVVDGTSTFNNTAVFNNGIIASDVTVNNDLNVANSIFVDGDLFVGGNTVSLNAQTLLVEDNIVVFGANNAADITDLGFATKYNNGASDLYAGIFRDATDGKFYLFNEFNINPPVTTMSGFTPANMTATLYGNFEANNLIASSGSLENMIANNITMTYSTIENSVIDCGTF